MTTREIATNDSGALATMLAEGTPLARHGQSESTANLQRASDHVFMAGLNVIQESLRFLFTMSDTMEVKMLEVMTLKILRCSLRTMTMNRITV